MENGAQSEVAFGGAKGGFGLCELDIPLPEQRRVFFGAVGAQQIRAAAFAGPLAALGAAAQIERAGAACGIPLDDDFDDARGGGILAQPASDAAAHCFDIGLRMAPQRGVDLCQLRAQPLALLPEHGAFLFGSRCAAAEHVLLGALAVGMGDEAGFHAAWHFLPAVLFQQQGLVSFQLAARGAQKVAGLAAAQEGEVVRADHAPAERSETDCDAGAAPQGWSGSDINPSPRCVRSSRIFAPSR